MTTDGHARSSVQQVVGPLSRDVEKESEKSVDYLPASK